ncbi:hypothetical protein [Streptomyces monomycini]|uniref:hypothetical protein n=1 Tax=Streptomyces monomycini TaxID=371720 RepID=UPI0004AB8025|nr:hypothetical protein [Streptomyces monomycini]
MSAQPAVRQCPRLPDGTGTASVDAGSTLPTQPVEVAFVPAEPHETEKEPGVGWLQPTGLVVHTTWHAPYPDRTRPYCQGRAVEGAQSWCISTPDGREVAAFAYFTRDRAEDAAAAIAATLPQGAWPRETAGDDGLYERAFDASTGPEMLPRTDGRGRPGWGYGADWIHWRMPPTRALYHRMIAKHGGAAPAKYCLSCRKTVRRARRDGWIPRTGHWPRWGTHRPGSRSKVHCYCSQCYVSVTIGTLGQVTDEHGHTAPAARSVGIHSPIGENGPAAFGLGAGSVLAEDRPFAWFRYLLADSGHVILDNRPCSGLWPEGVRHDDAFLCETGFTGADEQDAMS